MQHARMRLAAVQGRQPLLKISLRSELETADLHGTQMMENTERCASKCICQYSTGLMVPQSQQMQLQVTGPGHAELECRAFTLKDAQDQSPAAAFAENGAPFASFKVKARHSNSAWQGQWYLQSVTI